MLHYCLERIALSCHLYVLVAPGQCNKAPRGRQWDAGACSMIRKDGINPQAKAALMSDRKILEGTSVKDRPDDTGAWSFWQGQTGPGGTP